MEALTTIREMLQGSRIIVPTYQRAYSWDSPKPKTSRKTHTNVFLSDLEEYAKSGAVTSFYFGHFLFEEKGDVFYVIDGQQRLTTIVIFLCALFARLKELRELSEKETDYYEDLVKRRSTYRFTTVDYDNGIFIDYVIDQTKGNKIGIDTESAKRIVAAYDHFEECLEDKNEEYMMKMLDVIARSSCTTHTVRNESEAIQMFIFQNNRGKKPSTLEIVKAQFMYNIHLYGQEQREQLLGEVKRRFETIYKSISAIEYKVDEDDVLRFTLHVYFNTLSEINPLERINKKLSQQDPIPFIKELTLALENSFQNLVTFFAKDERNNHDIHSLVTLGGISVLFPFIIKAYTFGLEPETIGKLCAALESLVVRHRLIGTRADMTTRLNDEFMSFTDSTPSIDPIISRINMLKNTNEWWWAYWNNIELKKSIEAELADHSTAKFLLWKYENHLGKKDTGYEPVRYDRIVSPELEHIAPSTEPTEKPHGYDEYDEEFRKKYLNCLGNYLLLSKSHNCAVGNVPFSKKRETYTKLAQHRKIQEMTAESVTWTKEKILNRKHELIDFVCSTF